MTTETRLDCNTCQFRILGVHLAAFANRETLDFTSADCQDKIEDVSQTWDMDVPCGFAARSVIAAVNQTKEFPATRFALKRSLETSLSRGGQDA